MSLSLVEAVFQWARAVNPSQPLTAGVRFDNQPLNEFQLAASDLITFHNYRRTDHLAGQIAELKSLGRPLICTEWMARNCGSLVASHLSVFAAQGVGCLNWGLVAGKTNTIYPWKEVLDPALSAPADQEAEPEVWFQDLFRKDGTPYDQKEIDTFKRYTAECQISSSGVTFPNLLSAN